MSHTSPNSPLKVVVFGATGRTGRLVVQNALNQGHQVTAVVRHLDPDVWPQEITVIPCNALDQTVINQAIAGQDAVISVLGGTREGTPDLLTTVGTEVLQAMKTHQVQRLLTVIGAAVSLPEDPAPSLKRRLVVTLIQRIEAGFFADSQQWADRVRECDRDWTVVRVPRLVDGPRTDSYRTGALDLGLGAVARRTDVAHFLVQQLNRPDWVGRAPMFAS